MSNKVKEINVFKVFKQTEYDKVKRDDYFNKAFMAVCLSGSIIFLLFTKMILEKIWQAI